MVGSVPKPKAPISAAKQRRSSRIMILSLVAITAIVIACIYLPGKFTKSSDGCINVQLPGPVGAVLVHRCGAAAQKFCTENGVAATSQNPDIAGKVASECHKAGITP